MSKNEESISRLDASGRAVYILLNRLGGTAIFTVDELKSADSERIKAEALPDNTVKMSVIE